jgi:hypothetical protein
MQTNITRIHPEGSFQNFMSGFRDFLSTPADIDFAALLPEGEHDLLGGDAA